MATALPHSVLAVLAVLAMLVVTVASSCRCPMEMQPPVCGSDGNTYVSMCDLECAKAKTAGLTLWREGPCFAASRAVGAFTSGDIVVADLSSCLMRCLFDMDVELESCGAEDGVCHEDSAVAMSSCTCTCKAALPPTGVLGRPPTTKAAVDPAVQQWAARQILQAWHDAAAAKDPRSPRGAVRSASTSWRNALRVAQCVDNRGETLSQCMAACQRASPCIVDCSRMALDGMCQCGTSPACAPHPAAHGALGVLVAVAVAVWSAVRR